MRRPGAYEAQPACPPYDLQKECTVVALLSFSICPQGHLAEALVMSCRANQLDGLVNMGLASRRAISFKDPKSGKSYKLNDKASSGMHSRSWNEAAQSLLPHTCSPLPADSSCLSLLRSSAHLGGQHLGDW